MTKVPAAAVRRTRRRARGFMASSVAQYHRKEVAITQQDRLNPVPTQTETTTLLTLHQGRKARETETGLTAGSVETHHSIRNTSADAKALEAITPVRRAMRRARGVIYLHPAWKESFRSLRKGFMESSPCASLFQVLT